MITLLKHKNYLQMNENKMLQDSASLQCLNQSLNIWQSKINCLGTYRNAPSSSFVIFSLFSWSYCISEVYQSNMKIIMLWSSKEGNKILFLFSFLYILQCRILVKSAETFHFWCIWVGLLALNYYYEWITM